jgi:hypothetical protein
MKEEKIDGDIGKRFSERAVGKTEHTTAKSTHTYFSI